MATMEERIQDLVRCIEVLIDQRRTQAADRDQSGVAATQLQIEATQRAVEDERNRPDPLDDTRRKSFLDAIPRRQPRGIV